MQEKGSERRFGFREVVSSVGLYGCNSLPLHWRGRALQTRGALR